MGCEMPQGTPMLSDGVAGDDHSGKIARLGPRTLADRAVQGSLKRSQALFGQSVRNAAPETPSLSSISDPFRFAQRHCE